jgi:hypothetical protein
VESRNMKRVLFGLPVIVLLMDACNGGSPASRPEPTQVSVEPAQVI